MKSFTRARFIGAPQLCALLFGATTALVCNAQNATPQNSSNSPETLNVIVVTAQRREENIQTTPVAVTAISADELREHQVLTAQDLQYLAPSLNVSSNDYRDDDTYVIRGQGPTAMTTANVYGGGGTGVVTYFADTVANGAGPGLYYDLENVQVVNGPQGTLFGKDTTGGVVLFTPRKPTNDYDGYIDLGAGDYGMKSVDAAVNIPVISDKLLVRVAGEGYLRDGFTIDRGPYFPGKDYDNRDYWAGRVSIIFRPTENIENYTIFDILHSHDNGTGLVLTAVNPASAAASLLASFLAEQQAAGARSTAFDLDVFRRDQDWGVINTTKWFMSPDTTFKNIFSYKVQRTVNPIDNDATTYPLADLTGDTHYPWHTQTGTYTEEPQFQGKVLGGDLQWTTGAYSEYGRNIGLQPFYLNANGFELTQPNATNSERSYGIYGQTTYDLGSIWNSVRGVKLTTGARYSWDYYAAGLQLYTPTYGNLCYASFVGAPVATYPSSNCFEGGNGRSSALTWTLGLEDQLDPAVMVYLRSARGYLPGGFNPWVVDTSLPEHSFQPESVIDVEAGEKSQFSLAGMSGLLDADVFHSSFTNIQRLVSGVLPGGVQSGWFTNAEEAEIYGLELQGAIIPFRGLKLSAMYSYNRGNYTKIDPVVAPQLVGIPFANLPMHKVSVTAAYSLLSRSGIGGVDLSATYSYQSKFFDASDVDPFSYVQVYGLLNLGLNWNGMMGSAWDASFFMTNATNKTYRIGQEDNWLGGEDISLYGEPRMFVFKLRYSFGPEH